MNIAEIAKLAGVSNAAVSRYFNHGYISDEKREAIRKVVEETGYQPSMQAQTLRTRKTRMVGVIVPKIASVSIGRVVEGMLSVLNAGGYQALLAVTQNDPKKELEYLSAFQVKQVDGVVLIATVLTPEHKRALKKMEVPTVIVGQQLSGHNCVYHDDYHASFELTERVLEKERRNLGYIGAIRQDRAVGEERYRGYRDAVCGAGLEACAGQYATASFTVASGYEKAGELLERYPKLDSLICATDTMAAGVMQYLSEHGVRVPEQILVAGQGDSDIGRVLSPPLLTVHYSYEESGELAVRMLMEMLDQGKDVPRETRLGYRIVDPEA